MSITSLYLFDNIVYGTPSGNYDGSSQDFDSDGVKAVGYYPGQGNLQTVGIRVTNFEGTIVLQATLNDEWQTADWFDVYTYDAGATSPVTNYYPASLIGNFTWLRARVLDFQGGTINFVLVNY